MQFVMIIVAILAFCACTFAEYCNPETILELDGNVYCTAVQAIRYENVGTAGEYSQIINMSPNGECTSARKAFHGPLSPLDEEVSLHFRGPLHLKQLAVYKMKGHKKRGPLPTPSRFHGHQHLHKRIVEPEAVKEHVESDLTRANMEDSAEIIPEALDSVLANLVGFWFKPGKASKSTPTSTLVQTTPSAVAQPIATVSAIPQSSDTTIEFSRIGYYDSFSQHLDGLMFLGNHGGDGSGTFDGVYGASLSYLSADGTRGASSPQVLSDCIVGSATEYTVMTDNICNGDCGFVRPGSVAYHGFEGADKIFLIEFQMPLDGIRGFQGDTPAIWMLNAQIPRTIQYGNGNCSCWATGCGEFDIVEVLSSGLIQCKSTLHTNTPAGDSDYITRPTDKFMKLAVIFRSSSSTVHIQVLDDSFEFGKSLTSAQVDKIYSSTPGSLLSVFDIAA